MKAAWALGLVARIAAAAPDPLDKPAFAASPAELLAAAKAAPDHGGATVLREDQDATIDDRGRVTEHWRLVFVVREAEAADDWGVLSATYEPWHQDAPKVHARAIDPSGASVELDQSKITDQPETKKDSASGDRHEVRAELPALVVGSVVEEEVITRDRVPELASGGTSMFWFGSNSPLSSRVTYSAPAKRAHHVERALPAGGKTKHDVTAGRETWTWTFGAIAEVEREPNLPTDVFVQPYVAMSTMAGWADVARDTRKLIEDRIAAGAAPLPAEITARGSLDAARAVTAWLHAHVPYDELTLHDTSPVPAAPADVVHRGSGHAIELAAVLVSLLRQAGVPADVALLRSGTGLDIDRELPSLVLFDHAIVRARLDGRDVWIDPIEDLIPVGQLPSDDQGRRALVLAEGAKDLVTLPAAAPADNLVHEVRTFELSDHGPCRVTEVSHEGGVFEAGQRGWMRDTVTADVDKQLASYLKDHYSAEELESYRATPPSDLATPYTLTLVGKRATRAYTDRERAGVYLYPRDTLTKLPDALEGGDDVAPRKHDLQFSTPFIYEIENRIVWPAGFDVPAPAAERTRAIGTLKLVEQQRVEGQTLVVSYRLDSGKTRLTPAEVAATREAVRALREESVHLESMPTGWALVQQGKYRDAIAAAQKVAAAHPKDAIHQVRLAELYIEVGAGEAAKRAGKAAIALAPKDADARLVYGWTLEHDSFGRKYGFDHDRAAARAAIEQARKLDPKHYGAALELAQLLERSPHGRRYDPGADLPGAIEARRAVYTLDAKEENGLDLARLLLVAGQAIEATRIASGMPAGGERDAMLVAATAAGPGGLEAALRVASTLGTGSKRAQLMSAAGQLLMQARQYDAMRALMAKTSGLGTGTTDADKLIAHLARHSVPKVPTKDPVEAAEAALLAGFDPDRPRAAFWDDKTAEEVFETIRRDKGVLKSTDTMTFSGVVDITLTAIEATVEGDAGNWRVDTAELGKHAIAYVALDRGTAKLVGNIDAPEGVARHVLRLLAKHDEKTAARYLDWLQKDLVGHASGSRAGTFGMFRLVWTPTGPRDRATMELAAAVLANETADWKQMIAIASHCGTSNDDIQMICDVLLVTGYAHLRRWSELDDFAKDWAAHPPARLPTMPNATRVSALAHLGKLDEAGQLVRDLVARDPNDAIAAQAAAELAIARGDLGEAIKSLEVLAQKKDAKARELNWIAWLQMIARQDLTVALARAKQAARDVEHEAASINTAASIDVELGDLRAARDDLARSLDVRRADKANAGDWYVLGRYFEELGLRDDAIAAYKRETTTDFDDWGLGSYELGKKRLKALGKK